MWHIRDFHSPLDPEGSLLGDAEHVAVADHPEEAEQDHAARQHGGVELDTPDAGGDGGAAEQDGHPVTRAQGPGPGVGPATQTWSDMEEIESKQ